MLTALPRGLRGATLSRTFAFLTLLPALTALGCGVPLAASELTATAEVGALRQSSGSATEASSRAAGAPEGQPAPGATLVPVRSTSIAPLSTTSPVPSAPASVTAAATSAPAASGTPEPRATTSAVAAAGVDSALVLGDTSVPATDPSAALASLVNAYRIAIGRPPLTVNLSLSAAATAYAQYEGRTNSFGHTGPDGSIAETRIARAGYPGRFKGEALAAGQASADAAIKTWINSPSHNAILSSPEAVEVGIGYAYVAGSSFGHYWVLVTGMP